PITRRPPSPARRSVRSAISKLISRSCSAAPTRTPYRKPSRSATESWSPTAGQRSARRLDCRSASNTKRRSRRTIWTISSTRSTRWSCETRLAPWAGATPNRREVGAVERKAGGKFGAGGSPPARKFILRKFSHESEGLEPGRGPMVGQHGLKVFDVEASPRLRFLRRMSDMIIDQPIDQLGRRLPFEEALLDGQARGRLSRARNQMQELRDLLRPVARLEKADAGAQSAPALEPLILFVATRALVVLVEPHRRLDA